ncbi:glycosyltransferase family 2 protein [Macrococcus brunensis]|uniref:Putative glycosyltransferase TagX n=1 Tax=Macrococcus brunensis TaxID=198483 RepID=A0A4R6BAU5_9STAP|nr:glycosyltransferase family 2 protein [Macrococcus brunensis]TDL93396.1 glycosyltransferase family 2 protein [Macrococcus brunensis]
MCLVSVIIPTFNVEHDIIKCVESILNQSYKNVEIIIVDDASTDQTYQLVNQKYADHPQIKIFQNEINSKAAFTRNKAIEHAEGKYIAVQDADDYSDQSRLEKQIDFLETNPTYDFVGSNAYSYDEKGIWKKTHLLENPVLSDFYKGKFPFVHGSMMFKKSALAAVDNYRVAKETERGQDGDLLMRLYQSGFKGHNLTDALYYYQETIETVRKRNLKHRIKAVKNKFKYYSVKDLTTKDKIFIMRTLVIGFIPSKVWYQIMKFRARKTLKK